MGMAASQARLLSITARLTNNENTGQAISYSKQRLADQTQQVTNEYNEALDTTKLTVLTGFNGADANYTDISYNLMTGLQMADSMKQYVVTDTKGRILVTEQIAEAYQKGRGNYNMFLANLGFSQADINVQKTYADGDAKTTEQSAAEQKVHEAWDKYFETVGIQVGDPEHAVSPIYSWSETKNPVSGEYSIGDGYVGYRAITGYAQLEIDGQLVYEDKKVESPKKDKWGQDIYNEILGYDNTDTTFPTEYEQVFFGYKKEPLLDASGNPIVMYETDTEKKLVPDTTQEPQLDSDIFYNLGDFIIFKADTLVENNDKDNPQPWQNEIGVLANSKPYYCNYGVMNPIDAGTQIDIKEALDSGLTDPVTGLKLYYPPKVSVQEPQVYINGDANYVDDTSKPIAWEPKPIYDTNSGFKDPNVTYVPDETKPRYDYTKPQYSDEITPINYEGATQESRDLFDYAMAISEAYLRTNASGSNFNLEYDMNSLNSAFNNDNTSALKYYKNIFNKIQSSGYFTYTNTPAVANADPEHYIYANVGTGTAGNVQKSPLYDNVTFEAALRDGSLRLEYYSSTDKKFKTTTISEDNCIQEVKDERAIAKAESKYNQDMADLENKDNKLDLELKKLDTEHTALQTEYEAVKSVVDKNVESSFKIFS